MLPTHFFSISNFFCNMEYRWKETDKNEQVELWWKVIPVMEGAESAKIKAFLPSVRCVK